MTTEATTEAAAVESMVLDRIEGERAPFIIDGPTDRKFIAHPTDHGCWNVDEIQPLENERAPIPPKIVIQSVKLQQVESLVAYVNRFKNDHSLLFADISRDTILGIIDYHKPENGVVEASFAKHTASLVLPKSLEWQTWMAISDKLMPHVDFAGFLEENIYDVLPLGTMKNSEGEVVEDAPSTLFELVRELQVKSSYGATSAIRNGDYVSIEMQKGDDVATKRDVALPLSIQINIPVYFGEQPVLIEALIRRKVDQGSLRLGVKLVRPEQHRQDEFKRIVKAIEADVGLATHYGTPA